MEDYVKICLNNDNFVSGVNDPPTTQYPEAKTVVPDMKMGSFIPDIYSFMCSKKYMCTNPNFPWENKG